MSNLGKWDRHYAGVTTPQHYGASSSYQIGADWLADCDIVEDWGCGLGWFKQFCKRGYRGVDGSHSRFADVVADLEKYTSDVDGIFMRHVLEHNENWGTVLFNAVDSFSYRMCLVLFTPFAPTTTVLSFEDDYGVPTLALPQREIEQHFADCLWTLETIESPETFYGQEHIYYVTKP